MAKGLMTPVIEIEEDEYLIVTPEENKTNTEHTIKYWKLGPEKDPSDEPDNNKPYWAEMAATWKLSEEEARRQRCANCEYFDNTPEKLLEMDTIPRNDFDTGAGGRGYCHKFEFICHNLRSCTAWERKEYIKEC
jgi:hypothetical protein